MATTKHTCGGPVFGHKTPGCPRCDELINGAQPVQWKGSSRQTAAQQLCSAIWKHDCVASKCGRVCTYGDW